MLDFEVGKDLDSDGFADFGYLEKVSIYYYECKLSGFPVRIWKEMWINDGCYYPGVKIGNDKNWPSKGYLTDRNTGCWS